jgi:hypothetical protein
MVTVKAQTVGFNGMEFALIPLDKVAALVPAVPDSPIRISARSDENDLVLEVWNAGEPIPAESLGKIFEPLWRRSVSGSRNGLGLGLHICSQIVRAHAGRISMTSTRENGAQFTARLPLSTMLPTRSILSVTTRDTVCAALKSAIRAAPASP